MLRTLMLSAVILATMPALAQVPPAELKPTENHEWLQKFTGHWTSESECSMGPGQPPSKNTGTVDAQMLGEYWIRVTIKGGMPGGGTMEGLQTIGYDPKTEKYVGTWVDSVSTYIWKYEGFREGDKLTLEAEGPNMMTGEGTALYRDIYTFKSDDVLTFESKAKVGDEWVTFMHGESTRVKKN